MMENSVLENSAKLTERSKEIMLYLQSLEYSFFFLIIASPVQDILGGVFIFVMDVKTMWRLVHLAHIMSFQTTGTIRRGHKNTP